jgi:hypothetical protein
MFIILKSQGAKYTDEKFSITDIVQRCVVRI